MSLNALNFFKSPYIMHSDITSPISASNMLSIWRDSNTTNLLFYVFIVWWQSSLLVNLCTIFIDARDTNFEMIKLANIMISILWVHINHTTHIFTISILHNSLIYLYHGLRACGWINKMPKADSSIRWTCYKSSQGLFFLHLDSYIFIFIAKLHIIR
jgi:hypothetical protein